LPEARCLGTSVSSFRRSIVPPFREVPMRTLSALVIAALLIPSSGAAQDRWSLEVTTDAALPTEDLGPADLDYGAGFGANVRYPFQPHLAAYAGWESTPHHHRGPVPRSRSARSLAVRR
jgi:hypothetical protein